MIESEPESPGQEFECQTPFEPLNTCTHSFADNGNTRIDYAQICSKDRTILDIQCTSGRYCHEGRCITTPDDPAKGSASQSTPNYYEDYRVQSLRTANGNSGCGPGQSIPNGTFTCNGTQQNSLCLMCINGNFNDGPDQISGWPQSYCGNDCGFEAPGSNPEYQGETIDYISQHDESIQDLCTETTYERDSEGNILRDSRGQPICVPFGEYGCGITTTYNLIQSYCGGDITIGEIYDLYDPRNPDSIAYVSTDGTSFADNMEVLESYCFETENVLSAEINTGDYGSLCREIRSYIDAGHVVWVNGSYLGVNHHSVVVGYMSTANQCTFTFADPAYGNNRTFTIGEQVIPSRISLVSPEEE